MLSLFISAASSPGNVIVEGCFAVFVCLLSQIALAQLNIVSEKRKSQPLIKISYKNKNKRQFEA